MDILRLTCCKFGSSWLTFRRQTHCISFSYRIDNWKCVFCAWGESLKVHFSVLIRHFPDWWRWLNLGWSWCKGDHIFPYKVLSRTPANINCGWCCLVKRYITWGLRNCNRNDDTSELVVVTMVMGQVTKSSKNQKITSTSPQNIWLHICTHTIHTSVYKTSSKTVGHQNFL